MLINIIGFNLSWFGLILVGNNFIPVTVAWLFYHFYQNKDRKKQLLLISIVTLLGSAIDSTLLFVGVYEFQQQHIPLWLITLWAGFGATLYESMGFLAKSKYLQLIVGFIFPPFSYLAGGAFSAVELPYGTYITYCVLAPIWAVLLLIFYKIGENLQLGRNHDVI